MRKVNLDTLVIYREINQINKLTNYVNKIVTR